MSLDREAMTTALTLLGWAAYVGKGGRDGSPYEWELVRDRDGVRQTVYISSLSPESRFGGEHRAVGITVTDEYMQTLATARMDEIPLDVFAIIGADALEISTQ